jgi:hypothetical protein
VEERLGEKEGEGRRRRKTYWLWSLVWDLPALFDIFGFPPGPPYSPWTFACSFPPPAACHPPALPVPLLLPLLPNSRSVLLLVPPGISTTPQIGSLSTNHSPPWIQEGPTKEKHPVLVWSSWETPSVNILVGLEETWSESSRVPKKERRLCWVGLG